METKKGKTGTTTKVVKKDAKSELENTNKKVVAQKIIVHKELKYTYPKGCTDTLERKSFRQKVRNHVRKLERDIAKLKGEPRREKKAELEAYTADHLA